MNTDSQPSGLKLERFILVVFFFSGAASLIHEVAWTRLLRLVMGNTTLSIATVLCVFMAGLALGGYAGGRLIDRRRDPLRVFALLEGLIGAYCLAFPSLLEIIEPIYRSIYQSDIASLPVLTLTRFAFSAALLILPASCMGATLPILARWYVRSESQAAQSIGRLYAVNTIGAAVGAGITGFILLPNIGVTHTIWAGSILNFAVCIIGLALHYAIPPTQDIIQNTNSAQSNNASNANAPTLAYGRRTLIALLIGYGLSGFTALVYEIAWTRVLALMIGSSVYAFSMILTAFILGLGFGGMISSRYADRARDPLLALAFIQILIGASAFALVPMIGKLPVIATWLIAHVGDSFWLLQGAEFLLVIAVMGVPTLLMGAAFPIANKAYLMGHTKVGRSVGTVYGANTLGSIAGSFVGGFVLILVLGVQNTILFNVAINLVVGIIFLLLSRSWAWPIRGIIAALVVGSMASMNTASTWDAKMMSIGPFVQARWNSDVKDNTAAGLQEVADQTEIIFHEEGLTTTVTVKESPNGVRTLYVNGKADAVSHGGRSQQYLLAHLPILMHPDPKNVLQIGVASGITLGAAGRHPIENLDCVEISQVVVDATRLFDKFNHSILDDERLNIILADGRNHLELTSKRYDVIISQPSNPWIAGVADLFTVEFFELCHARLTEQGVACIWMETDNLDAQSFRSIVRTFTDTFEGTTLWKTATNEFLMIGHKAKPKIDFRRFYENLAEPNVAQSMNVIYIETFSQLLSNLFMGPTNAKLFAQGAPIHTDDNALIEFKSPRTMIRNDSQAKLLLDLEGYREADFSFIQPHPADEAAWQLVIDEAAPFILAEGLASKANGYLMEDRIEEAASTFKEAAALDPQNYQVRHYQNTQRTLANEHVKKERFLKAITICQRLVYINPASFPDRMNLAALLRDTQQLGQAYIQYNEALKIDPSSFKAHYNSAKLAEKRGEFNNAIGHFRATLTLQANSSDIMNNLAWLLVTQRPSDDSAVAEAIELAQKACELTDHRNPYLLDTLRVAYETSGRLAEAVATAKLAMTHTATKDKALTEELRAWLAQQE